MANPISKIRRYLRLPRNAKGRDFVVGDLHGHRTLLERELHRFGFDPSCDRVLSVGDLIDRGPESLAALSLIEEPWFHAVLGNHELMLLNFLGYYPSQLHSRRAFPTGGGLWIRDALAHNRKTVGRLAERLAAMPLAIHVDADMPFNVTHADLRSIGPVGGGSIAVHKADRITSTRKHSAEALKAARLQLRFAHHPVQVSPTPLADMAITYVGHSPLRHVTVHDSHVYIDQRVCAGSSGHAADTPPTVLDHRKFAFWLGGVALARAGTAEGLAVPRTRLRTTNASPLAA